MTDEAMGMMKVATKEEIPLGTGKIIEVNGKTIALFNCEGTFYAIENFCKHQDGPLGEGILSGTNVTCPWHGWGYDVRTGECVTDPSVKVQAFNVKLDGEDILVSV